VLLRRPRIITVRIIEYIHLLCDGGTPTPMIQARAALETLRDGNRRFVNELASRR